MPFKSEAQRRFFNSDKAKESGISQKTVDEFNSSSKGMKLPEKMSGVDKLKARAKKRLAELK